MAKQKRRSTAGATTGVRIKSSEPAAALDEATTKGSEYFAEGNFAKAKAYFQAALEWAAKLPSDRGSPSSVNDEFLALRSLAEIAAKERHRADVVSAVGRMIPFARATDNPSILQLAYHVAAQCYLDVFDADAAYDDDEAKKMLLQAEKYANRSVQYITKFKKDIDRIVTAARTQDSCDVRLLRIQQVLGNVYQAMGKVKDAVTVYDKILANSIVNTKANSDLKFATLYSKRVCLPLGPRRLAVSEHALKTARQIPSDDPGKDLNVAEAEYCYAVDSLLGPDHVDSALEHLWNAHRVFQSHNSVNGEDAVALLVALYKIKLWRRRAARLPAKDPKVARIYEKCGDTACEVKAFELGLWCYRKMEQICPDAPVLLHSALMSIGATCDDLERFDDSVKVYERLLALELSQGYAEKQLASTRLNLASAKAGLAFLPLREKIAAFESAKPAAKDSVQYESWLVSYTNFLRSNRLADELRVYQAELDAFVPIDEPSQSTEAGSSYTDEIDALTTDETMRQVETHMKTVAENREFERKRDLKTPNGETALHEAARAGNLKLVRRLMEACGYSAVLDKRDNGGWTALSEAVVHQRASVVAYLIAQGADVNTKSVEASLGEDDTECSSGGQTCLMEACSNGNVAIIRALLSAKAKVIVENMSGRTAADYLDDYLERNPDIDSDKKAELVKLLQGFRKVEADAGKGDRIKPPEVLLQPPPPPPSRRPADPAPKVTEEQRNLLDYRKVIDCLGSRPRAGDVAHRRIIDDSPPDDADGLDDPNFVENDFVSDDDDDDLENFPLSRQTARTPSPLPEAIEVRPRGPSKRPTQKQRRSPDIIEVDLQGNVGSDDDDVEVVATRPAPRRSSTKRPARQSTLDDFSQPAKKRSTLSETSSSRGSLGNGNRQGSSRSSVSSKTNSSSDILNVDLTLVDGLTRLLIRMLEQESLVRNRTTIRDVSNLARAQLEDEDFEKFVIERNGITLNEDQSLDAVFKEFAIKKVKLDIVVYEWQCPGPRALLQRSPDLALFPKLLATLEKANTTQRLDLSTFDVSYLSESEALALWRAVTLCFARKPLRVFSIANCPLFAPNSVSRDHLRALASCVSCLLASAVDVDLSLAAVPDDLLVLLAADTPRASTEALNLSFGIFRCSTVASFLRLYTKELRRLNLSGVMWLTSTGSMDDVVAVISEMKKLTHLDLSGCELLSAGHVSQIESSCRQLVEFTRHQTPSESEASRTSGVISDPYFVQIIRMLMDSHA